MVRCGGSIPSHFNHIPGITLISIVSGTYDLSDSSRIESECTECSFVWLIFVLFGVQPTRQVVRVVLSVHSI